MQKIIKIARIFAHYKGPSDYYLLQRMQLLGEVSDKYETCCIYTETKSSEPNNQEDFFDCFYLNAKGKINKILKLAKALKEADIDVIHCNRIKELQLAVYASFLVKKKIKIISHIHGINRCRGFKRKLFFKLFSRKVKALIGCSENVKKDIITNFPKMLQKAYHVPNSIDYNKYHNATVNQSQRSDIGLDKSDFVFFLAARLVETKGHDLLINSFAKLAEEKSNVKLLLAGEGRLRDKLQERCKKLNITPKVIFLGQREDVPELLKQSDAFTLSSVNEGFGLCLIEAMAAGIPIIATGNGGPKQIIGQHYGFYVEDRTVENFYSGMKKVYELNNNERQELIRKADKRVKEDFSHERAVKELIKIYDSIL